MFKMYKTHGCTSYESDDLTFFWNFSNELYCAYAKAGVFFRVVPKPAAGSITWKLVKNVHSRPHSDLLNEKP